MSDLRGLNERVSPRTIAVAGAFLAGVIACAGLLPVPTAMGEIDNENGIVAFQVAAENLQGSGTVVVTFDEGAWEEETGTFSWVLPAPVDIYSDQGVYVATMIDGAVFARCTQPCEIEMYLGVAAGVTNTTFVAQSPLVEFATVPEAGAAMRSVVSVTLTDADEGSAAMLAPEGDGTGMFRAYYNGYLSEGTRFTHLMGLLRVTNGGTITAVQTDPAAGFAALGEPLSDFSTEVSFLMTGGDVAFMNASAGVPTPPACEGDIDGNGAVDIQDMNRLLASYGTQSPDVGYDEAADLVPDYRIDLADLHYLLTYYGDSCW